MMRENEKITVDHLGRSAFLYVRQSTVRQVIENTESTQRQYGLRQRAINLGWSEDQVVVIDDDLGKSAASGSERGGFQRLVAEVGMGRAGIVMGLEVSRLARNCSEWHKLLEICGLSRTLILDEDGLYDPTTFNDRLLLGLKGTMSEAELYIIRARLRGGMLNKARRGELVFRLPVGFVLDGTGKVVFDPDKEVQQIIRLFFDSFRQLGSAQGVVRSFRVQDIKFPKRLHTGVDKGKLIWGPLTTSRAIQLLYNPWYAGTYSYGRRQVRRLGDGRIVCEQFSQDKWHALILDAHQGYISWPTWQQNQKQLAANVMYSKKQTPARKGPALLQGVVVCGLCGRRMSPRYHKTNTGLTYHYCCQGLGNTQALPACQIIPGVGIDKVISDLLIEVVTPANLKVALAVQDEVQKRIEEVDQVYQRQVERVSYETDLARRRYMEVDPANRLVAGTLEAEWNDKLAALQEAQQEYERRSKVAHLDLDEETRTRILALASDFPSLWQNPNVPFQEKKRMVRLMIEDVTLVKGENIQVKVRFKGGATRTLTVQCSQGGWEKWKTPEALVKEVDRLLDNHTYGEIVTIFKKRGLVTGMEKEYDSRRIRLIQRYYGLKPRLIRLKQAGLLTTDEIAQRLGITKRRVRYLRHKGRLRVGMRKLSDAGDYMYEPPTPEINEKKSLLTRRTQEVQYE